MMNLFQYHQSSLQDKQQNRRVQDYLSFLEMRQDFKIKAVARRGQRLRDFVQYQNSKYAPDIIQDEYMNKTTSKGNKEYSSSMSIVNRSSLMVQSVDHKGRPNVGRDTRWNCNQSMDKSRRRSEQQRLKVTQEDKKYLSYSLPPKQKNISESAMNFKEKADKILRNYKNDKHRFQKAQQLSRDRYRLAQVTHFDYTKITADKQAQEHKKANSNHSQGAICEQSQLPQKEEEEEIYFSEIGEMRRRDRTYFKLAKRAQLFAISSQDKSQLDTLMSRSHYDRVKKQELTSTRAHSFISTKGRFSVDISMITK